MTHRLPILALVLLLPACAASPFGSPADAPGRERLEWVRLSEDGQKFVLSESGASFVPWGVNYDHDRTGRLLEEMWDQDWPIVKQDFAEMKALGVNVARIHLQVEAFMDAPDRVDEQALQRLGRLVDLAEDTGIYLDVTGLGCYDKGRVPAWYDELPEPERWAVQARFWNAVAGACADSPAIFCYNLMNEPIVPGANEKQEDWLAGEFGGKHFVQRISLDLAGRTREEVARSWIDMLVSAIREEDDRHLVTLGVIPWALVWPNARPFFHAEGIGDRLDFASVHFYPKSGEVQKALDALAVYDVGKPLVIEEMFPLGCSIDELEEFIRGSRGIAEGWISFYWGKTIEEHRAQAPRSFAEEITMQWLERFREMGKEMAQPSGSADAAP